MTIKEGLIAARAKVAAGWIQGVSARDAEGKVTLSWEPSAVCWCAYGAIKSLKLGGDIESGMINALEVQLPGGYSRITHFNDTHTQRDVLDLFDKAIGANS